MAEFKFMCTCETCGSEFQFGRHVYAGKRLPRYDIMVCKICYEANWDGWAPHFEEKVTRKLLAQEKPLPARNADGLLPRD